MDSICAHHALTGNGQGLEFLASVAEWAYDNHNEFQVCSYYSLKDIHI